MESDAKYAFVGAVVVLLTVAVVAAILWLSDDGLSRDTERYVVYFEDHSLSGLQIDSDVTMRGIKVGTVRGIAISPKNIEQLEVRLLLDASTPVKTDSKAVIRRNLLTGLAWVDITGSSQEAQLLRTVDRRSPEGFPIIPEGKTDLEAIADSVPSLVEEVSQIAQRINGFLSEDNREQVSAILSNVEAFSKTLASNDKEISSLIKNVSDTAAEIRTLSKTWRKLANDADAAIGAIEQEATQALSTTREAVDKVDDELIILARSLRNTSDVFAVEAAAITKAISLGAQAIARVSQEFEDPKGIIFGPNSESLGPGEEREE